MIDAKAIASQLLDARRDRVPIAPFTDSEPGFDLATAYEAQGLFVQGLAEAGERVVGAKLGLTSRAKQEAMGLTEPLSGWLTDAMVLEPGVAVPLEQLIQPRAEPEIAFLLARPLEAPATVTSVLAATEAVFCAVDILDSRYEHYRFALPDVVADNCSSGAFVLGPRARRPGELEDLRLLGCVWRHRGEIVATAAGAAAMGHPAAPVAWLANRLAATGEALPAGSIVLSGGLTAPVPLTPGTSVTAEFDGLGTVEVWA
ncbi:MAG TPA: fumarylacetoacetate hydrolase family protein [Acidimicrobiia bacterium]|nr:fumarylacetoacetate hydrolase family protein [Acidimicrobiia bacterium]